MNYQTAYEVLCKRQNWLKTRVTTAQREGRFLSHDQAEIDALELGIELLEVGANGERNES